MNLFKNQVPLNETQLKQTLKELKNGDRAWKSEHIEAIIFSMLTHIGSTDHELRDQLIYATFYQLIVEDNRLDLDLLLELLNTSLTKPFLFYGIGENGTDSVFTRSFTTLLIALILYRDRQDHFLPKSIVLEVKESIIRYLHLEKT